MQEEEKLKIIDEIKRGERELYLKRSLLGSAEAMEYGTTSRSLLADGLDADEWKRVFSKLIELVGFHSTGGDSVDDLRKERDR